MNMMHAQRADRMTRQATDPREHEADVVRRVTYALKEALEQEGIARARAITDNRRLWIALEASVRHPANQLPRETKIALLNTGRAVMREMESQAPDIGFMIEVNEQLAAGLR
ncbi:MAG: hypothetical protein FJX33_10570 [Alphaproteobacteria bacterium]|nr:hypothetical protein [Alphaproteobacteria bacterium]